MRKKKLLFALVFVGFSLAGCLKKPNVEICQFDVNQPTVLCGMSEEPDGELFLKPLEDMDGSTMFTPKAWEKIQNYIDELEIELEEK